ncbi:MAG: hypothetical protein COT73_05385 [Bdellovibrio sp. CG10_big_fil_rev_8_21_14_0_10_47_8]|nr:MAG: hypothetical protein COT73_05385 [Bdellovibrio sp. CG10_big_fil_rev_8_21_14_0_10_47_8]
MSHNVLQSAAVERLKGIIRSRYGKGFQIRWITDISDHDGDEGVRLHHGHLFIPIQTSNHYFATAVIEEAHTMSVDDHETITELVRLVLEPEFYNWYLSQLSHNAKAQTAQPLNTEVASIHTPVNLSANSTLVICLESPNPHQIPRLSFEIHELAQRWAYLKFSDIQDQVHNVEDLRSLGSLTLWVQDILMLTPHHRTIIEEYIHGVSSDSPLLVLGTSSSIESLETNELISSSFADVLKSHRLQVERLPRNSDLLQETLEIMLQV